MVAGHCSSPKSFNSSVPHDSVLSSILFLLFINDLLNLTQCPIHSYGDDSTLHFSTSFSRHSKQKQVNDSCGDATECLLIFPYFQIGAEKTLCCSMPKKFNSFIYPLDKIFSDYPLYFDDIYLSPSSTTNILGLSFTKSLNWKSHISSLAKSASKNLGVMSSPSRVNP